MTVPVWNKEKWKEKNTDSNLPMYNVNGSLLVIGCNYHTTWQSHRSMRFVLTEIKDTKARLQTRNSRKDFWTNVDDLIFIESGHNKQKARKLRETNSKNGSNDNHSK
jgi:hypothetical protein